MVESTLQAPLDVLKRSGLSDDKCTSSTSQPRLIAPSPNFELSTATHSTPVPSAPDMSSLPPQRGLKRRISFSGVEPFKKKAARDSGKLQDIEWGLNDKLSGVDLQTRRDQFYKQLEAIEVEKAKGNKKQTVASKKKMLQTVIDVTNFFFNEVMDPDAFQRVASIIADYNARNYNQIGSNAVTRAVYLASINGTPTVIRSFYTSFANAERFNANSNSNYARLLKSMYDVELYKSFLALRASVQMRDPSLVQFLERKGLKTAIGRGYRSLVMKYVTGKVM
jgi:CRISPR/Cas system CSM-associated protein Csm2 small subunit